MKKLFLIFISISVFLPNSLKSQNDGAGAAAAGALALGLSILSIENYKEQLELSATEWLLNERSDLTNFRLQTLDFDGKKVKDMSSTSVITFKVEEFDPNRMPKFLTAESNLGGRKWVLMAFTSYGWMNENGVDFSRVKWFLIDRMKWLSMMTAYVKAASGITNEELIMSRISAGRIVNKGVRERTSSSLTIPFYKLGNDMYIVAEYDEDLKFIYNENSLGIYLKKTKDLVQMSRNVLLDINGFFFNY